MPPSKRTLKKTRGTFRARPDDLIAKWGRYLTWWQKVVILVGSIFAYFVLAWFFGSVTGPLLVVAPILYATFNRGNRITPGEVRWALSLAIVGAYFLFVKLVAGGILFLIGIALLVWIWLPAILRARQGGGGLGDVVRLEGTFRDHTVKGRVARKKFRALTVLTLFLALLWVPAAEARETICDDIQEDSMVRRGLRECGFGRKSIFQDVNHAAREILCVGSAADLSTGKIDYAQRAQDCATGQVAPPPTHLLTVNTKFNPSNGHSGAGATITQVAPTYPQVDPAAVQEQRETFLRSTFNPIIAAAVPPSNPAPAPSAPAPQTSSGNVQPPPQGPPPGPTFCGSVGMSCETCVQTHNNCHGIYGPSVCQMIPSPFGPSIVPCSPTAAESLVNVLTGRNTNIVTNPTGAETLLAGNTPAGAPIGMARSVAQAVLPFFFRADSSSVKVPPGVKDGQLVEVTFIANKEAKTTSAQVRCPNGAVTGATVANERMVAVADGPSQEHVTFAWPVVCRGMVVFEGRAESMDGVVSAHEIAVNIPSSAPSITLMGVEGRMLKDGETKTFDPVVPLTLIFGVTTPDAATEDDVPNLVDYVELEGVTCEYEDGDEGVCLYDVDSTEVRVPIEGLDDGMHIMTFRAVSTNGITSAPVVYKFRLDSTPVVTVTGTKLQQEEEGPVVLSSTYRCSKDALIKFTVNWGRTASKTFPTRSATVNCGTEERTNSDILLYQYPAAGTYYQTVRYEVLDNNGNLVSGPHTVTSGGTSYFETRALDLDEDVEGPPTGGDSSTNAPPSGTENPSNPNPPADPEPTAPVSNQSGTTNPISNIGTSIKNGANDAKTGAQSLFVRLTNGWPGVALLLVGVALVGVVVFFWARSRGKLSKFGLEPVVAAPEFNLGKKPSFVKRLFTKKATPPPMPAPSSAPTINFNLPPETPTRSHALDDDFDDLGMGGDDFGEPYRGTFRRKPPRRR